MASMLEDYVQIVIQYFFFEKYLTAPDVFIYVNAMLMFVSSLFYLKTLVKGLNEHIDWGYWLLAACGVLAVMYQTSRLAGTVYQMHRPGGVIKESEFKKK
jgi:hypothetical protein